MTAKSCLIHHPDTDNTAIKALYIGVRANYRDGKLTLSYDLQGNIANILIPDPKHTAEIDNLWQHTCFEAFVAVEEEEAYHEFNFSPSGEWAAYAFDDYRAKKTWSAQSSPKMTCFIREDQLAMTVIVNEENLPENPFNKSYRLGLSAVLETKNGELFYWALCHPAGKPDFHHRSGFTLSFNLPLRC